MALTTRNPLTAVNLCIVDHKGPELRDLTILLESTSSLGSPDLMLMTWLFVCKHIESPMEVVCLEQRANSVTSEQRHDEALKELTDRLRPPMAF